MTRTSADGGSGGVDVLASSTADELVVRDLRVAFGGIRALDGPSFSILPGQICGMIGPNGAGKTTLFNCVSRLYQPDSGSITFGEVDLLRRSAHQIADVGIARTFQNIGLFSSQTALENIMSGAYTTYRLGVRRAVLNTKSTRVREREIRERAHEMLTRFGLANVAERQVAYLPFGSQKKVELARALISSPKLVLLDEPANGLTHSEVMDLAETINRLHEEDQFSVLLVEHHLKMVMAISDHLVVLNFGQKLAEGTPDQIKNDPTVISAYLGGIA